MAVGPRPHPFNYMPIKNRLQLAFAPRRSASACCSNPSPVLDDDCFGNPIVRCGNCGAQT